MYALVPPVDIIIINQIPLLLYKTAIFLLFSLLFSSLQLQIYTGVYYSYLLLVQNYQLKTIERQQCQPWDKIV